MGRTRTLPPIMDPKLSKQKVWAQGLDNCNDIPTQLQPICEFRVGVLKWIRITQDMPKKKEYWNWRIGCRVSLELFWWASSCWLNPWLTESGPLLTEFGSIIRTVVYPRVGITTLHAKVRNWEHTCFKMRAAYGLGVQMTYGHPNCF